MEPVNTSDISSRKLLTPKRLNSFGIFKSRELSLKIEIADFAISNSIKSASKKFNCDRKCVRRYIEKRRQHEDLLQFAGKLIIEMVFGSEIKYEILSTVH